MSAPLFLFMACALITGVAFTLRNRPTVASIFTAVAIAFLGLFTLLAPIQEPIEILDLPLKFAEGWQILGREFVLSQQTRLMASFMFFTGAFIFAVDWLARPGRYFLSLGVLILTGVQASLLIEPFLYAAILLELVAMLSVLMLYTSSSRSNTQVIYLLVVYTIALMAVLLTGWFLENTAVTSSTPDLARQVIVLLTFGFALLMVVPPFHFWLPPLAGRSSPYALIFVVAMMQTAGLFFMFRFLDTYIWLRASDFFLDIIRWLSLLSMGIGTLMASAQRSFVRAMLYLILFDLGVTLMAVAQNSPTAYQIALGLTTVRIISLSVWALGATLLLADSDQGVKGILGIGHGRPILVFGTIVGGLSLVGFPLTAGFPGRWGLFIILRQGGFIESILILLGIVIGSLTLLRWGRWMLMPADGSVDRIREHPAGRWESNVLLGGTIMCFLLGVFPQLIYPWIATIVNSLENLMAMVGFPAL